MSSKQSSPTIFSTRSSFVHLSPLFLLHPSQFPSSIYLPQLTSCKSHSWYANRFSANKKIPSVLWNPKVHYRPTQQPAIYHYSESDESIPLPPPQYNFLKIPFNIILPYTTMLSKCSLFLTFPHKNPVCTSSHPHTCHMHHPFHSSWFDRWPWPIQAPVTVRNIHT